MTNAAPLLILTGGLALALLSLNVGAQPASCGVPAPEVVQRLNATRAASHRCGARVMPPAPPLRWDPALGAAAQAHSIDMAAHNYLEHRSASGESVRDRVEAARYRAKEIAENIAAGSTDLPDTIQSWLASPKHCENLMDPGFSDVAVACAVKPGAQWDTYWTMVLGRR